MGVEPFLITSTLNAVLAQRLVRRLCQSCREPFVPTQAMLDALEIDHPIGIVERLYRPVGCPACKHTGFKGRIAVLELLIVDETTERLVLARAEARDIQSAAGLRTMLEDGLEKARAGLTTLDEVLRVTREG
jgi:general secretion pathway protein E